MDTLQQLVNARDAEGIRAFMREHDMVLREGKIVPRDDVAKTKLVELSLFWNQRQQARKILLNSLYGALLNEGLRFYDERLGQSVTLSGRSIVRHMNAKVNEVITGKYDYKGEAVKYADTDSCYFSARDYLIKNNLMTAEELTRDVMVKLYDEVAMATNDSFAEFMAGYFGTTIERGAIIKAGRELVASTGLFIKKKKYGLLVYDDEGKRLDQDDKPGKLKAMGLDLKRADTPSYMQQFLEQTLMGLLTGESKESLLEKIRNFRDEFRSMERWQMGSPKKVNGLTKYGDAMSDQNTFVARAEQQKKLTIPGHVRASMNWNRLLEINHDKHTQPITDGARIVVCKLQANIMGMDSIAYPIDEHRLPQWFTELPFDTTLMEEVIIDKKLENLVGVLEWDIGQTKGGDDDCYFS
jgi:DNA polymerase elongation subunit (family B)